MRIGGALLLGIAVAAALCGAAAGAPASIRNLTGLPAYPNLSKAAMDEVYRTEALGRWCARFTATTTDSLPAVEEWYRKTLVQASETDLSRDEQFKSYPSLSGIKLALGIDYVALYRLANQSTIIELHRCSRNR
ncbi:MAG: hypothetical protein ABSG29_09930 [Steroidobacteraceae bacterium]|jgi:hypothetical protein